MTEKIGKYEIVERIDGGGAGVVYKARDKRLNRLVAIRVVTPEGKVTDEYRSRFFAEAQSAASLNHPNIITIHDIDEEDGRLYVVMELLEGKDLRHLIKENSDLAVEDKASVMAQLCSALQYVQSKDVPQPDIEPGNVVLQPDGLAKILDFGVAKLAKPSDPSGSKILPSRYLSPEHLKGPVGPLSDQYRLASFFYELLSHQPAFAIEDPAALLEKLQTDSPKPLLDIAKDLPADLVKIVERGMSKAGADRYPDLTAMRADIEAVQRRLSEEAQPIRQRLVELLAEQHKVATDVAKRLGTQAPAAPSSDLPAHIGVLQKATTQAEESLKGLRATIAKLDAVEPIAADAEKLLGAGKFAEAREKFEKVLADVAEHTASKAGLEKARAGEETERRKQATAKLLEEARAALEAKLGEKCLALLEKAAAIPAPDEATAEINKVREDAKRLIAEQEATLRAKKQAEGARTIAAEARAHAEKDDATKYATASWEQSEKMLAEGNELFKSEKFTEAFSSFEKVAVAYRGVLDNARAAKEKERREAEAAEAARRLKLTNEILTEARAAMAERAYLKCQEILRRAVEIPPPDESTAAIRELDDAAEKALASERAARPAAQTARMIMSETRTNAQADDGAERAPAAWKEAEAKSAEGATAFAAELYVTANEAFEIATKSYRAAVDQARAAKQAEKDKAEATRREAADKERQQLADKFLGEARAALERGDYALALDILETASKLSPTPQAQEQIAALRRSVDQAREAKNATDNARLAEEREREGAQRARDQMMEQIRSLRTANAASIPAARWDAVEAKMAEANTAFSQRNYLAALACYEAGIQTCQQITDEIRKSAAAAPPAGTNAGATTPTATPASAQVQSAAPATTPAPPAAAKPADQTATANVTAPTNVAATAKATPPPASQPAAKATTPPAAKAPPTAAAKASPTAAAVASANAPSSSPEDANTVLTPSRAERTAGVKPKPKDNKKDSAPNEGDGKSSPVLLALGVAATAAALAAAMLYFQIPAVPPPTEQPASSASPAQTQPATPPTEPAAAVAAPARVDAGQLAQQAAAAAKVVEAERAASEVAAKADAATKAKADAAKATEAKAAAEKLAAAEEKAAAAEAAADAAAKAKADADAKAEKSADGKPLFVKAYASVFIEPTDGKRGGGAWGACWRADPAAARSCAKASCEGTRKTVQLCKELASTEPGGHCAVATSSGYGVSTASCGATRAAAEGSALSSCKYQLTRNYIGANAACKIAWSTVQ